MPGDERWKTPPPVFYSAYLAIQIFGYCTDCSGLSCRPGRMVLRIEDRAEKSDCIFVFSVLPSDRVSIDAFVRRDGPPANIR